MSWLIEIYIWVYTSDEISIKVYTLGVGSFAHCSIYDSGVVGVVIAV